MVGATVADADAVEVGAGDDEGATAAAQALTAVAESAVRSCLRRMS
jgi:hypothetical protein